ncbi:hypothetical protein QUB63_06260 [Microcoleus sp. ARI1-B5]|uniref:hypothetical protein n=1 Tax=unclassified Microcoleus TaxID=2642155 RepID=UPI002FD39BFA
MTAQRIGCEGAIALTVRSPGSVSKHLSGAGLVGAGSPISMIPIQDMCKPALPAPKGKIRPFTC